MAYGLKGKVLSKIVFDGVGYSCLPEQSVLECLTAHGVAVPSGCRAGVCQSCLMRALSGPVPSIAQEGLKATLAVQGYFLACRCQPSADMTVSLTSEGLRQEAEVVALEPLNEQILAVRLRPRAPLEYRPGQFIRLYRTPELSRCYSLASVPALDEHLEIHVRRMSQGQVSGWVHEILKAGDQVQIADSAGNCFYAPGNVEQTIVLLGTGSGLAPLYGIVRDALHQAHRGPIWLYHGGYTAAGLYRQPELEALAEAYPQFRYIPCVSGQEAEKSSRRGTVLEAALADHADFSAMRVFLCGHPEMVKDARMQIFLAGASMADIMADPFLPSVS